MRLQQIHWLDNKARHTTLGVVLKQVLELNGSRRIVAVTKIKLQTSPWVCVRHFNTTLPPKKRGRYTAATACSSAATNTARCLPRITAHAARVKLNRLFVLFAAARVSARCASSAPPQQNITRTIPGAHHVSCGIDVESVSAPLPT